MQRVVLHVGHPKTGSSYLQGCLALNKESLLDLNIEYPMKQSSRRIEESFRRDRLGYVGGNGNNLFQILSASKTSSENTLLFSGEGLFLNLITQRKGEFCDLLSSSKYSFEVIVYSRNLFEFLFSSWGQRVKIDKETRDLNNFLLQGPFHIHRSILAWIKLSKEYDFTLTIKNYSNFKKSLAKQFFFDLTGSKDFLFITPPVEKVNRSLTFVETEFQRVFNKTSDFTLPLSEYLVSNLPEINSSQFRCTREAYDFVVCNCRDVFEEINKYLSDEDFLKIENADQIVDDYFLDNYGISDEQVDVISSYILRCMHNRAPDEVNSIRDVAIKISRNQAQLVDALWLMEFALKCRPNGDAIRNYVNLWKGELS